MIFLRDLVRLYFKDKDIVNHHVESFNDFLATPENLNSRMQKIVDDIKVSEVSDALQVRVYTIKSNGYDFVDSCLGIS